MMSDQQRRSLSGGAAGSSPAFSAADVLRAHAMGVAMQDAPLVEVTLSPGDVLGMRNQTETVLATIRNERAARVAAEKRLTVAEESIIDAQMREHELVAMAKWQASSARRWRGLAMLAVPYVAVQAMVILWLVSR